MEKNVTYETKIAIEVAGIRRAIPVEFRYRVKAIGGKRTPIHDSAAVRCGRRRFPGDWVYEAIGVRQLRALDDLLLAHSTAFNPGDPFGNPAQQEAKRKIA